MSLLIGHDHFINCHEGVGGHGRHDIGEDLNRLVVGPVMKNGSQIVVLGACRRSISKNELCLAPSTTYL